MPHWISKIEEKDGGVHKYSLQEEGAPLSFQQVINYWARDASFRDYYQQLLGASPFAAYFWEHPPLTLGTLLQPYEMVLVDSPALARIYPNARPFNKQLGVDQLVVDFLNLSGDTHLVVPNQLGDNDYSHLANFCRQAPTVQAQLLWQQLGQILPQFIQQRTTWLSTSGLGVHWLHLRISSRPKYYAYAPYRSV